MKTTAWLMTLGAGLAMAQQGLDQLPECAKSCVIKYMSGDELKGCNLGDIKCICTNTDLLQGMSCCLSDACGGEDQRKAIETATSICGSAGVSVPREIACNNSASSSSSATASSAASSPAPSSSTSSSSPAASSSGAAASVKVSSGVAGAVLAMLAAI